MKIFRILLGIFIIIVGLVLLLSNLGIITFDFSLLWPLFLLVPGLLFELSCLAGNKDPGLLVPGGILTTYGVLFFVNIIWGWHLMEYLWPVFPLGVAIGLFQLYIFGKRETALLIPVGIIGGFSLVALSFTLTGLTFDVAFPIVLIAVGLIILLSRKRPDKNSPS